MLLATPRMDQLPKSPVFTILSGQTTAANSQSIHGFWLKMTTTRMEKRIEQGWPKGDLNDRIPPPGAKVIK
ncbi:MAG: hypothetical protein ETSY2_20660 [Candidatus Entotheonella gemina]|uniref:Uncharacterized protein n=1 Tax=Candidatus Entotheonella gemina TaxID=1429439 RepID=W4M7G0_9BACT|nr:MAG: hypothetical protein ETSY2_20660 [Candidatus Entotheonella gemina]